MTLEEYLEHINKQVKKHPELLKLKVVYGIDDEGNRFQEVVFKPSPGIWDGESFDASTKPTKDSNAFCIN